MIQSFIIDADWFWRWIADDLQMNSNAFFCSNDSKFYYRRRFILQIINKIFVEILMKIGNNMEKWFKVLSSKLIDFEDEWQMICKWIADALFCSNDSKFYDQRRFILQTINRIFVDILMEIGNNMEQNFSFVIRWGFISWMLSFSPRFCISFCNFWRFVDYSYLADRNNRKTDFLRLSYWFCYLDWKKVLILFNWFEIYYLCRCFWRISVEIWRRLWGRCQVMWCRTTALCSTMELYCLELVFSLQKAHKSLNQKKMWKCCHDILVLIRQ